MSHFYKQLIFISLGVAILAAGAVLVFGRTKTIRVGGYGATTTATCDIDPASCTDDGLVGYWDMSQMAGQTVSDKSGNNNTGTLGASAASGSDDPRWASGVQPFSGGRPGGGALQFDGVDDYISIPNFNLQ